MECTSGHRPDLCASRVTQATEAAPLLEGRALGSPTAASWLVTAVVSYRCSARSSPRSESYTVSASGPRAVSATATSNVVCCWFLALPPARTRLASCLPRLQPPTERHQSRQRALTAQNHPRSPRWVPWSRRKRPTGAPVRSGASPAASRASRTSCGSRRSSWRRSKPRFRLSLTGKTAY